MRYALPLSLHPLKSVAPFRPMGVLGAAFVARHTPQIEQDRQAAANALYLARFTLEQATSAYAAACVDVGELNHRARKHRHDRTIYSDRYFARLRSAAFGTMNRRRGTMIRARKALVAAEAALLALAH